MPTKPQRTPKPTDEERHKRFVDTAREIGASEKAEDFDKAFEKVTLPHRRFERPPA